MARYLVKAIHKPTGNYFKKNISGRALSFMKHSKKYQIRTYWRDS